MMADQHTTLEIHKQSSEIKETAADSQRVEGTESIDRKQNERGDKFIARVPDHLHKEMEALPQVVSLGPFHYRSTKLPKLAKHETLKGQHLVPEACGPSFEKLVEVIISQKIKLIEQWYSIPEHECTHEYERELGRMMARDGLFLLRFLKKMHSTKRRSDPLFQRKVQIQQDIMKLENQIPFFVVNMVLQWEAVTDKGKAGTDIWEDMCEDIWEDMCEDIWEYDFIKIRQSCIILCPFPNINVPFINGPFKRDLNSHLLKFMYDNIIGSSGGFMYDNIIGSSGDSSTYHNEHIFFSSERKKSSRCYLLLRILIRMTSRCYLLLRILVRMLVRMTSRCYLLLRILVRMTSIISLLKALKVGENKMSKDKHNNSLPTAAELEGRGVNFTAIKSPLALNQIRFDDITCRFYLPIIKMDSTTDVVMRNLLAFELYVCKGGTQPVRCYIDLMERLIDNVEDVKVLRNADIIRNHLSDDKEVANVWNAMRGVLDQEKGEYEPIGTAFNDVRDFYSNKYRTMWAEFKRKYFSKPWLVVALVGGIIQLFLSLVQTILAWEQRK